MNIQLFNITWRNVSDNLLPWYLRDLTNFDPRTKNPYFVREYTYSIMIAFEPLTNRLFELAFNIRNKTNFTGQVGVLEIALNDYFDSAQRRIFISDGGAVLLNNSILNSYLQAEINPDPLDLYLQGEPAPPNTNGLNTDAGAAGEFDFLVNIPNVLGVNTEEVRSLVDTYKTAGKTYDLLFF